MLKFLLEKEFKQIIRNAFIPKLIISYPILVMLIFPWVANQEIKGLKISVVDNDHSTYSTRLIQKVISSGYFELSDISPNNDVAVESMEVGDVDIILDIQKDFEKSLVNEGVSKVMISANAVNGIKAGLGASYLASILGDYAGELREENIAKIVSTGNEQVSVVPHLNVVPQYRFNPFLEYDVFMIPALIAMLLTLLCGFLPALNIVGEKEIGTIEQMNVTPVKKYIFTLAKLIPYWIIGFVIQAIAMIIAFLIYGLSPVGSIFTILIFSLVYLLVLSGMGLVISNYSNTIQQAMFLMFFFLIIFILMSGLLTPINSMPEWAKVIAAFTPLTYFIEVMRLVYLKGSAFSEMIPQFLVLCVFALVFCVWALLSYRKSN